MESYYKSRVVTFMLARTSEYTSMTRKLCSNGARTILKDLKSNYRTLNQILSAKLFLSLCRLLLLNPGAREEYLTSQLLWVYA